MRQSQLVGVFRDQVIFSATKTENGTKHPIIELVEQNVAAVPYQSWNFKEEIVDENKLKDMFYSQLSKTKIGIPVPPPPREKWETVPEQTPCDSEAEKEALHDLIISSEPGSIFAVYGKPGTGKTFFVNNSHDEKCPIGLIPKLENKG